MRELNKAWLLKELKACDRMGEGSVADTNARQNTASVEMGYE